MFSYIGIFVLYYKDNLYNFGHSFPLFVQQMEGTFAWQHWRKRSKPFSVEKGMYFYLIYGNIK